MKYYPLVLALIMFTQLACADDPSLYNLREYNIYESPNAELLRIVVDAIRAEQTRIYADQKCTVQEDKELGTVQGDWCPVHKGEVLELIQVHIVGDLYQIDVWHKSRWPFSSAYKGLMSKVTEFSLHNEIKAMRELAPNKSLNQIGAKDAPPG